MSGNLFKAFLGGHTPAQSWDTKKELEGLGDSAPASPQLVGRVALPAPRQPLMALLRDRYSTGAVRALLLRLDPDAVFTDDAIADFQRFVDRLSDSDVRLVYGKLMHVAETREASREPRLSSASSVQRSKKGAGGRKHRPRSRRRSKKQATAEKAQFAGETKIQYALSFGSAATHCAKCGQALMQSERYQSREHAEAFGGMSYCRTHAPRLALSPRELSHLESPRPAVSPPVPAVESHPQRLSAPDTVVVAADGAWDFYRRHSAYVCQAGRSFKDVHYVAFYRDKRVEPAVPRILEWRDRVPFTRENANRLLDSELERDQALGAVIWNSLLEGSRIEGARHQVLMLTPEDDARTTFLDRPIRHDGRGPWLRHQRYTWMDALKVSRTTTEMAKHS